MSVGGMFNMYNNLTQFEILTLQQGERNFVLAVIVAIITLLSTIGVYWDYRHRKNKERAEKSIHIAEEFAKNVITPISILDAFFEKLEIDKIINKIDFLQLEDFDNEELKNIYDQKDIDSYIKIMNTGDPEGKIRTLICNTLNRLEYLCMYISTNVANEKYIYNSLHQQFLSAIALLYFEISMPNIDDKDKYYTNIIHVYNLWKNKYIKATTKQDKFKKKQRKLKKKLLPAPKI